MAHASKPVKTGKQCQYCDGTKHHLKDRTMTVVCTGQPPYCYLCRSTNGACPYCQGTGIELDHWR